MKTIISTRKISGLALLCSSISNHPAKRIAGSQPKGNAGNAFSAGCPVQVNAGRKNGELEMRTSRELKNRLRITVTDIEGNMIAQRIAGPGEAYAFCGLKKGAHVFRIYCNGRELSGGTILIS